MKPTTSESVLSAAQQITRCITELTDWRGPMLAQLRQLIGGSSPNLSEEWKWGTPVWAQKGNVVSVGVFKDHLKINFFKGALLHDPQNLFNAGLDAKASRAIDLYEGSEINALALQDLVRAAITHNLSAKKLGDNA